MALCTIILCAELLGGVEGIQRDSPAASNVAVSEHASSDAPRRPDNVHHRVNELLARPLFSPARRVVAVPSPAPRREAAPRLAGIISGPGGELAIFAPREGRQSVVVRKGDEVGAWLVQNIRPEEVTVSDGDALVVLRPTFADVPADTTPIQSPTARRARDPWGHFARPPTYLERRG